MVKARLILPVPKALQAGTVNVARYLNKPDAVLLKKVLRPTLLIGRNPLKDISQTKKVEGVMIDCKWLSKEYISAALQELVK